MKLNIKQLKTSRPTQLIVLTAVVVTGVIALLFAKAAAPTATLSITPTNTTATSYDVGTNFSVNVTVDSQLTQIQGANLAITYDPNLLQLSDSVTPINSFVTPTPTANNLTFIRKSVKITTGTLNTLYFAAFADPNTGNGYTTGPQLIATISFTVKAAGTSSLKILDDTANNISTVTPFAGTTNIWDHLNGVLPLNLTTPDTSGPNVTNASPTTGTVHDSTAVSATITDPSSVASATLTIGTATPVAMTAGSNGLYTYNWVTNSVADGSYALKIIATDGKNNVTTVTIGTVTVQNAKPDLVISAVTLSPAAPKVGDAVTITATVKNQGSLATPSGTSYATSFVIDGNPVGQSVVDTNAIPVGGIRTETATWTATTGSHSLVVTADSANQITELFENNNVNTSTISTTALDTSPPTFTATPLTLSPATTPIVGIVAITANVSDIGTNATGVGKVEFYLDSITSTPFATISTSPYTVTSWNSATTTDGAHTIYAKAYDKATPANVSTSSGLAITIKNTPTPGDATGDGHVTYADLTVVLNDYGATGQSRVQGDVSGDGKVDYNDLILILNNWGK